jgi:hypothetical protein
MKLLTLISPEHIGIASAADILAPADGTRPGALI